MLDDRMSGTSHSKLERIFFEKVRASGLPVPVRQYGIGDRYIDVAYPVQRVIVELDGYSTRFSAASLRDDRRRQNEIVLALPGWTLLRFTWDDVVEKWASVETALRRALKPV
jgi:very-short-patch-repair endonuclease